MPEELRARDVFVAGGSPTVTYQSRSHLEDEVLNYLDFGSSEILSVSGPTKTGKTVLIRHVVNECTRVEGGQVADLDDFLYAVLDDFDVPTEYQRSAGFEDAKSIEHEGKINAKFVGYKYKKQGGGKGSTSVSHTTKRSLKVAASDALLSGGVPLVVDDFHYINVDTQVEIVRFLKSLVFEGLPVILISVPHRAYDAVRAESEMTGRVRVLEVGFWSEADLLRIAEEGFPALNVYDANGAVAKELVNQTFASPHLMQRFCLSICEENGLPKAADVSFALRAPEGGWKPFFRKLSSHASKSAFDRLARGGRQRKDRIPRHLISGQIVDIYGVVLEAIADTGPQVSLRYEDIRTSIRNILASNYPQRNEVTKVLEQMSKIATTEIEGEPVVDWDSSEEILHISDPYFAFYLCWGSRETVILRS